MPIFVLPAPADAAYTRPTASVAAAAPAINRKLRRFWPLGLFAFMGYLRMSFDPRARILHRFRKLRHFAFDEGGELNQGVAPEVEALAPELFLHVGRLKRAIHLGIET